ncbi:MAG: GntR family transcriptional regulator [Chloroflexi bacterium]|nr:GntR family transcriptional regulator [Chloroflexota bacterium]
MNDARLQPVRQRTLSDESTERLRAAIRNGALPPGTRLIEQDLAQMLEVSRIPVREAIQRLVEEGLVNKVPHRGAFVYLPTLKEIEEISSLRVVLERFIVARAIARWRPQHENTLCQIVAQMRQAAEQRDFQQMYELDYNFHYALWEIAEHSLMLEVVSSLRSRISRFLYEATSALTPAHLTVHVNSHDELIEIIKAGDVAIAQEEIEKHVLAAKDRIVTYCQLMPTESEE